MFVKLLQSDALKTKNALNSDRKMIIFSLSENVEALQQTRQDSNKPHKNKTQKRSPQNFRQHLYQGQQSIK